MQTQTAGKHYGGLRKVIGALLVTTSLLIAAAAVATVGNLDIPGSGSDASPTRAAVVDTYTGPKHGEGLPLSVEQPGQVVAQPARRITVERDLSAPQGEGFPMTFEDRDAVSELPKLGEGLPRGSGQ